MNKPDKPFVAQVGPAGFYHSTLESALAAVERSVQSALDRHPGWTRRAVDREVHGVVYHYINAVDAKGKPRAGGYAAPRVEVAR